jgi:hypothetical protein
MNLEWAAHEHVYTKDKVRHTNKTLIYRPNITWLVKFRKNKSFKEINEDAKCRNKHTAHLRVQESKIFFSERDTQLPLSQNWFGLVMDFQRHVKRSRQYVIVFEMKSTNS